MADSTNPMSTPTPCPFLPPVDRAWPAAALTGLDPLGGDAGEFYLTALRCAQSRWLDGLPAQSLLMLNRAFSCGFEDDNPLVDAHPWPYEALAWLLRQTPEDRFLGNPRRHFQHLATRMNQGPRRDLRVARAWACWAIAGNIRPELPGDDEQVAAENLTLPTLAEIAALPVWEDRPKEATLWQRTAFGERALGEWSRPAASPSSRESRIHPPSASQDEP